MVLTNEKQLSMMNLSPKNHVTGVVWCFMFVLLYLVTSQCVFVLLESHLLMHVEYESLSHKRLSLIVKSNTPLILIFLKIKLD